MKTQILSIIFISILSFSMRASAEVKSTQPTTKQLERVAFHLATPAFIVATAAIEAVAKYKLLVTAIELGIVTNESVIIAATTKSALTMNLSRAGWIGLAAAAGVHLGYGIVQLEKYLGGGPFKMVGEAMGDFAYRKLNKKEIDDTNREMNNQKVISSYRARVNTDKKAKTKS